MHKSLFDLVEEAPSAEITIDLESQSVSMPGDQTFEFPIDPFSKTCLLKGVDQLCYIMSFDKEIAAFENLANWFVIASKRQRARQSQETISFSFHEIAMAEEHRLAMT